MKDRTIIALDGVELDRALELARDLSGNVWGFKLNDLIIKHGVSAISKIKSYGYVFADLKLCDIPNTVSNSIKHLSSAGADFITVHSACGLAGLSAAVSAAKESKIFAVTLLTSLSEEDSLRIHQRSPLDSVLTLASIAKEANCFGIISSPQEVEEVRKHPLLSSLKVITPGIRNDFDLDDQKRSTTASFAFRSGADYIVVGRAVCQAKNPIQALDKLFTDKS